MIPSLYSRSPFGLIAIIHERAPERLLIVYNFPGVEIRLIIDLFLLTGVI